MDKSSNPSELFKERLKAARELRGVSQTELAQRTGLQASAVSHFETGTRKPSFDNLKRLADALEVTTDFLLGRADEPTGLGETADPLYRKFQDLKQEDREAARRMIEAMARDQKKDKAR